jgi:hypothetical protein
MSHQVNPPATRFRPLLAAALLLAFTLPVGAEEKKLDSSLSLIPADAAFYGTMLRNREQVNAVANSKTWAKITKLPYYQLARLAIQQQFAGDQFAEVRTWMEQEENRDLLAMLTDAVSDDMFCYGGGNWVDFVDLFQQMNSSSRYAGPIEQFLKDPNFKDQKAMQYAQVRGMLRALARNPKKIKFPDLVLGFKIKDAKKAEAQIARLETIAQALSGLNPMFQDRVKRTKVGDSNLLTLNFDGEMVPWDEIDWKDVEEAAGEFDGVRKNLKKLKLTIALGVSQGYLLFSIGSSTDGIAALAGQGPRLTSRAELKPLMAHAGKRLTGISYSSKAMAAVSQMSKEDIDELANITEKALDAGGIAESKRKAIVKDVKGLASEFKKSMTPAGASLSFSYRSDRGYEGYEYQYGEFPDRDSSKPLSLLQHVGGDPIMATVGRSKNTLEQYLQMSKWIKVAFGHAEPIILEKLKEPEKKQYEEISKLVFPLLKRFDDTTAKMLLPALADGQAGLVLDAKWKSKQWHPQIPQAGKVLPMPELAVLVGVSDRDLLEKAVQSYGKLIEDVLVEVKKHAPPDSQPPFTKLPTPEVKEGKSGKIYLWRLPKELQLDERVAVTAGLSEKVGVVAMSAEHVERLLSGKPLKVEGGPLANAKRSLTGASYFNWPVFVDALSPWVMFAVEQAPLDQLPPAGAGAKKDGDANKNQRELVFLHVRTILDALKAIGISSSATYIEDGAMVTHSEVVIHDE